MNKSACQILDAAASYQTGMPGVRRTALIRRAENDLNARMISDNGWRDGVGL
jgi:hypothetical protein